MARIGYPRSIIEDNVWRRVRACRLADLTRLDVHSGDADRRPQTATALGLTIPPTLLTLADTVIE